MRCVYGPCTAALHVLIALIVLGVCMLPAPCCWRGTVWCMHVLCFDWDVHSCLDCEVLWASLVGLGAV